ncbi:right-handed parallel beta-helix repeat-containing protein [Azospirillum sp.]|uniref:right-handed parallel beta-helix repeat-containing protein n=1 Tax=Azospirillum sp. TaxID=34012 RepID=UPI002D742C41|nr:right-handed parallel beta-helix repeat-containing protein [Azospirillum sp.]HYD69130.1 right-handed parallel beta-helix repeat-containing protein [Azospirillum sp.]
MAGRRHTRARGDSIVLIGVLALLFCLSAAVPALAQGVVYVSPRGDDRWTGRSPEPSPDGRDGPFATLDRALAAVRGGGPKTVLLRGGTYRLTEPVRLGPEDEGLRIAAFPGERPVFSGGEAVGPFQAEAGGVFSAPLAREPGLDAVLDGTRLTAARSGDYDPAEPIRTGWFVATAIKGGGDKRRFRYAPGTVDARWAAPGVRVQALDRDRQADDIAGIERIEAARNTLVLDRDGVQPFREGSTFRLLGHPDFLKHPGQFAWRARDKRLLVLPENPADLDAQPVVVARLGALFRLVDARGVALEGLRFEDVPHTGAAVRIEGGEGNRIVGNAFRHVGTAVEVLASPDNEIRANRMEHLGRAGVDLKPGSHGTRVLGNSMRHVGEVALFSAGVFVSGCQNTRIAHNDIRHAARYGISVKNTGPETINIDTAIEYNRIEDTARETADAGAVEVLGLSDIDTRTAIRFNDIRRTGGLATDAAGRWLERHRGFGVYLDDLTNGVRVEGNFLMDTGMAAVFIHGGDGNRVHNNIAVLTRAQDKFLRLEWVPRAGIAGFLKDNAITRNIIHARAPVTQIVETHTGGEAEMDLNIIDRPGRSPGRGAPTQARAASGPRLPAPYFVDPAADDFRLRPNSPAQELGIEDLPWARIGPQGLGR